MNAFKQIRFFDAGRIAVLAGALLAATVGGVAATTATAFAQTPLFHVGPPPVVITKPDGSLAFATLPSLGTPVSVVNSNGVVTYTFADGSTFATVGPVPPELLGGATVSAGSPAPFTYSVPGAISSVINGANAAGNNATGNNATGNNANGNNATGNNATGNNGTGNNGTGNDGTNK